MWFILISTENHLSPYYFVFCMLTWVAAPTFLLIFALCQDQKWKDCCEYFEFVIWALIAFIPSFLFVYLILPYSAIYYGVLGLCHTEQGDLLRGVDKKTIRREGTFNYLTYVLFSILVFLVSWALSEALYQTLFALVLYDSRLS